MNSQLYQSQKENRSVNLDGGNVSCEKFVIGVERKNGNRCKNYTRNTQNSKTVKNQNRFSPYDNHGSKFEKSADTSSKSMDEADEYFPVIDDATLCKIASRTENQNDVYIKNHSESQIQGFIDDDVLYKMVTSIENQNDVCIKNNSEGQTQGFIDDDTLYKLSCKFEPSVDDVLETRIEGQTEGFIDDDILYKLSCEFEPSTDDKFDRNLQDTSY